jgi:hypothetical protein
MEKREAAMRPEDADIYLRFAGECLRKASLEREPTKRGLRVILAAALAKLAERARADPPAGHGREPSGPRVIH